MELQLQGNIRQHVGSVESSSLNLLGTFRDLFVLPCLLIA